VITEAESDNQLASIKGSFKENFLPEEMEMAQFKEREFECIQVLETRAEQDSCGIRFQILIYI